MSILVTMAAACNQKAKPFLEGKNQCVGYDQAQVPVVKGTFSITAVTETGWFGGRWQITSISSADETSAYLSGEGDLEGSVDQTSLEINFNPMMYDNNFLFDATIEGERLIGTMRFDGFAGGPVLGRFEGTRVSTQ